MVNLHKKTPPRYDPGVKTDKETRDAASGKRKGLPGGGTLPSGIPPDKEHTLLALIERGLPFSTACAKSGISYFTFCEWMIRGGDEKSTDKRKPAEGDEQEPYVGFVLRVRAAEAEAETKAVDALMGFADKDWRAMQFWLSKRNPAEWGDRGTSVSVESGGSVTILLPDNGRDREKINE